MSIAIPHCFRLNTFWKPWMKARPFVTLYDYLVNLQPLYFSSVRYMFLCNQKFILMKDITNKFYYLLQKQKRYSVFCDILLIFQEFSFVTIYLKQSLLKNRQLYRLPNTTFLYFTLFLMQILLLSLWRLFVFKNSVVWEIFVLEFWRLLVIELFTFHQLVITII